MGNLNIHWTAGAESDVVDTEFKPIVLLEVPEVFAGTKLTIKGRTQRAILGRVTTEGTAIQIAFTAGDTIVLDPYRLAGVRFLTLASDVAPADDSSIQATTLDALP